MDYVPFAELTGDQSFGTACSRYVQGSFNRILEASPFNQGLGLSYFASTATWAVTAEGVTTTFDDGDRDPNSNEFGQYYRREAQPGSLQMLSLLTPPGLDPPARFARTIVFVDGSPISDLETRHCVFGVPTDLKDGLPQYSSHDARHAYGTYNITGQAVVYHQDDSVESFNLAGSAAAFSANPADGRIEISIDLSGQGGISPGVTESFGKVAGFTRIDGIEQSFDGELVDEQPQSGNLTSGSFGGWFFGPKGSEVGFAFVVSRQRADGTKIDISGVVVGTGGGEFAPA